MTTKGYKRIVCPICSRDNHSRPTVDGKSYFRVTGCWCITNEEVNELIFAGDFHAQRPIRERLRREALEKRKNDPPDAHERVILALQANHEWLIGKIAEYCADPLILPKALSIWIASAARTCHERDVAAVDEHVVRRYYPPLGLLDDAVAVIQGVTDDRGDRQQPPSDNEGRPKKRRSRRGRHKRPAIADPGANAG